MIMITASPVSVISFVLVLTRFVFVLFLPSPDFLRRHCIITVFRVMSFSGRARTVHILSWRFERSINRLRLIRRYDPTHSARCDLTFADA